MPVGLVRAARSPTVGLFFTRRFLPALFIILTTSQVIEAVRLGWIGLDAEIYYRASAAWLSGSSPWDAYATFQGANGALYHYSALPPMVVIGAPLTLLPEAIVVPLWIALSAVAAVYIVQRLHMPRYWLVFPPMVEAVLSGNPSIVVLALLVSASPLAQATAPLFKVYAIVPLFAERRWRAVSLAGLGIGLSLVAWPLWFDYLRDLGPRSARLMSEALGGFSGTRDPLLFLLAAVSLVALLRVDRRAAGWLSVILLWPATEFHYSTLAMPVMSPILAVGLAFRTQGFPVFTIALYALYRLASSIRAKCQAEAVARHSPPSPGDLVTLRSDERVVFP